MNKIFKIFIYVCTVFLVIGCANDMINLTADVNEGYAKLDGSRWRYSFPEKINFIVVEVDGKSLVGRKEGYRGYNEIRLSPGKHEVHVKYKYSSAFSYNIFNGIAHFEVIMEESKNYVINAEFIKMAVSTIYPKFGIWIEDGDGKKVTVVKIKDSWKKNNLQMNKF